MAVAKDQTSHLQRSMKLWQLASVDERPVTNLWQRAETIAGWRCGRIVTQDGQLVNIQRRRWPYYGNMVQVVWDMTFRPLDRDRCELYYHLPLGSPDYLILNYVHSGARTSLSTFYLATIVLDEIARLKGAKAILCNVTNHRISDRLMLRWGWQAHCKGWKGRHYIKRFYGDFPEVAPHWRDRLRADNHEPGVGRACQDGKALPSPGFGERGQG